MNNGWIKMHRSIMDWEWYKDSEALHLFIHLLIEANHSNKYWMGVLVKRGEFVTSIASLSKATGITAKKIRARLDKFEETGEIKRTASNKHTIITVINYNNYQDSVGEESKPEKEEPPLNVYENRYVDNGETEKLALENGELVNIPAYAVKAKADIINSGTELNQLMQRLVMQALVKKEDIDTFNVDMRLKYVDLFILHALGSNNIEGRTSSSVFKHFNNWMVLKLKNQKRNSNETDRRSDKDAEQRREKLMRQAAEATFNSAKEDNSNNRVDWL